MTQTTGKSFNDLIGQFLRKVTGKQLFGFGSSELFYKL
jgi:hypothetical protein